MFARWCILALLVSSVQITTGAEIILRLDHMCHSSENYVECRDNLVTSASHCDQLKYYAECLDHRGKCCEAGSDNLAAFHNSLSTVRTSGVECKTPLIDSVFECTGELSAGTRTGVETVITVLMAAVCLYTASI